MITDHDGDHDHECIGDDHGCLGLLMIRMVRMLVFKMKIKDANFQIQRHGPVYAAKRLRRARCWIFQGKISKFGFKSVKG